MKGMKNMKGKTFMPFMFFMVDFSLIRLGRVIGG
jgi:hypothetical protein